MQILDIVLYSISGERRILSFRIGQVNIITGSSKTGKSALIDIVDYCLGRGSCNVPVGPIRNTVSWYGLRLQFSNSQIFIARKNPPPGNNSTNIAFLQEAVTIDIPDTAPEQNTTSSAVEDYINNKLAISPNLNVPPAGHSRPSLEANFRHALFFCFQQQNDIASRNQLFHRQNESHTLQAIKDTLPYFLGAIREDALALEQQLRQAKRDLRGAEKTLEEAESIKGEGISKAISLASQAAEAGLIDNGIEFPNDIDSLIELLQQVIQWTPDRVLLPHSDRLELLHDRVRELQEQATSKKNAIHAAQIYAREADGYASVARQQELRLESIGLFDNLLNKKNQDSSICPLCSHELSEPIPQAEAIKNSIKKIQQELDYVDRDKPKLREYIEELHSELEVIHRDLQSTYQSIEGVLNEQEESRRWREESLNRSRVVGRISFWLENTIFTDETFELRSRVAQAETRVRDIENLLDPEEKNQRLLSALNRIGLQMTQWAGRLHLEHANGETPVSLDFTRGTIVVDTILPSGLFP